MSFHDDRTAGRQRRSGVATRGRKCERKITGAKHDHRAQRNLAHAQIRTRQRLAIGQGRIDAQSHPTAFAKFIGEQSQLIDRARRSLVSRASGNPDSACAAIEQLVTERHDLFADRFEELEHVARGRDRDTRETPTKQARKQR